MEILENLWQVGGGDLSAPEDAAIYLVRSGEQAALIDAGCGNGHERLVENISSVLAVDIPIRYLFLTHCHYDHVGGLEALLDTNVQPVVYVHGAFPDSFVEGVRERTELVIVTGPTIAKRPGALLTLSQLFVGGFR